MYPNDQKQKPDQTHGAEIERTHEMYEKGMPAPGTRDAGQDGKDFVAHEDNKGANSDDSQKK